MPSLLSSVLNVPIYSGASTSTAPGAVNLPPIVLPAAANAPAPPSSGPSALTPVLPAASKAGDADVKQVPAALTPTDAPTTTKTSQAPEPVPIGNVGVFITPQALAAFPVAAAVVTIVWKVLGRVFPAWNGNPKLALLVALVVGVVIFVNSKTNAKTASTKFVAVAVAIFNSFMLAATALGINSLI